MHVDGRVLLPTDFSDASFAALDQVLEMVDEAQQVHMVHVVPHVVPSEPYAAWGFDETRWPPKMEGELRRRLDLNDRTRKVASSVTMGDPGWEICELAQRLAVSLIVIPSHGRSGLKRVLLGSVAERVVRLAHCPVLVLRREE